MRAPLLVLSLFAASSLAVGQETRPTTRPSEEQAEPKRSPLPPLGHPAGVFGDGVNQTKTIPLAEAARQVKELHGRPIVVQGLLKDVCRKKGCWTILKDGEQEVRVKFRDYSFFVPRDASGRTAIVEGIVTAQTISEEVAKHYAEEGGSPEEAEKIKGPQQVLTFTATGVEILGKRELPPVAEAANPEVRAALCAKIGAGQQTGRGPAIKDAPSALVLLRGLKGPRTVEFSLHTRLEVEGEVWYVFSSSKQGFAAGYAVQADGTVKGF